MKCNRVTFHLDDRSVDVSARVDDEPSTFRGIDAIIDETTVEKKVRVSPLSAKYRFKRPISTSVKTDGESRKMVLHD